MCWMFEEYPVFANFTIGMIGNDTGLLLKSADLSRKPINKHETLHMTRRDIAASSLKILWENFDPVKKIGK